MDHSPSYIDGNKAAWEEAFEQRSPDWGVDVLPRLQNERYPFLAREIVDEIQSIDWSGKTVGQFCCNNGRELMSIVKQGARAGIGFDLAENQVAFANRIAAALPLRCTFIATNILDIPAAYHDTLDFLLISIGSLCWFQDLPPFFEKVRRCVKTGGTVLVHEMHPVTNLFAVPGDDDYDASHPASILHSYFHNTWIENDGMPYITRRSYTSKTFTSYSHSLTSIFAAALQAGLQITRFEEFERDISGGEFAALESQGIPLSYLLRLRKAA